MAKTTRSEICHTGEGVLEVDVKLLEGGEEGRRDPPPPICRTFRGQIPLDGRLMRLLILLFKVQRLHDPPAQCAMDMETTRGAGDDVGEGEAAMIWAAAGDEERWWRRRGTCKVQRACSSDNPKTTPNRPPVGEGEGARGGGISIYGGL